MLVLSRKINEKIKIGKDVVITVVQILGDRVRIGVEAPPNVEVYRSELEKEWRHRGKKANGNGVE